MNQVGGVEDTIGFGKGDHRVCDILLRAYIRISKEGAEAFNAVVEAWIRIVRDEVAAAAVYAEVEPCVVEAPRP